MAAIASVINWQNSADAESYGVAALALANRTDINVLSDIPGKIVSFLDTTAPITSADLVTVLHLCQCVWLCSLLLVMALLLAMSLHVRMHLFKSPGSRLRLRLHAVPVAFVLVQ